MAKSLVDELAALRDNIQKHATEEKEYPVEYAVEALFDLFQQVVTYVDMLRDLVNGDVAEAMTEHEEAWHDEEWYEEEETEADIVDAEVVENVEDGEEALAAAMGGAYF